MTLCYMYMLECSDGTIYTGSTKNLLRRYMEHQGGYGANYTSKRLPVKLIYFEEFTRIDFAFKREHQIKKWSQAKKHALIRQEYDKLHKLAECRNETHYKNR